MSTQRVHLTQAVSPTQRRLENLATAFVGFAVVFCLLVSTALAQLEGGRITGSIRDTSGAAIANASIDVANTATGEHLALTTNSTGNFTSPTLRPGTYNVTVSAPAFETARQEHVVVNIGGQPAVNLALAVGSSKVTVEVAAQAPAMDTTEATVGTVVESRPVQELPLNGRNALALTLETPTVRSNSASNPEGFADRGTSLAAIVINNGPTSKNEILLDGANNLNDFSGELAINPAVDAVQEFKVQSGYMAAEYGLTGGGVITLSTKSGTNRYSGDVYEFLRNDYLDARDYFLDPTAPKPPLRYNQYGGAVGGPVKHDKLFFFSNFESYKYETSAVYLGSVPSLIERNGDFSDLRTCTAGASGPVLKAVPVYDPNTTAAAATSFTRTQFPGNKIPQSRLDPVAVNIENAIYPTPNRVSSDACQALTNTNNFQSVKPAHQSMYQGLGRMDYHLSAKQSLFARYSYNTFNTDNGTTQGSYLTSPVIDHRYDSFGSHSGLLAYTYIISPTTINEVRAAVTRTLFPFVVANYNQNWPSKLGFPANVPSYVFPEISGTGLPAVTGQVGQRNTTNPQLSDSVTLVRGRHTIRFGGDVRDNQANNTQMTTPSGNFTFSTALTNLPSSPAGSGNAYASFLLGALQSATLTVYREPGYWDGQVAGFVQDDWKISRRFTLNAGLRYDFQQEPYEHYNGLSNFDPNSTNSTGLKGITVYAPYQGRRTFAPNDYRDFGPRLGFAWDVFGDGKTSVRGGGGIYYVNVNDQLFHESTSGFSSTTTTYSSINAGIYPAFQLSAGFPYAPLQPQGAAGGPNFLLGQAAAYVQPVGKTPSSIQANLNIQHEFRGHLVAEIGYLANNGYHMLAGDYNMNGLPDQYLSLGTALQQNVPNPYAGMVTGSLGAATISRKQSLLPYPYYGAITVTTPRDGTFHGNSMILAVKRQAANGLTLFASYTLSKLLDSGIQDPLSGYIGISTVPDTVTPQDPNNRRLEYSLDPSNITHRFVASALYDLPFGTGRQFLSHSSGVIDRLIGGWEVTSIVTAQTGLPLAITGANNNAATRPDFVPGITASDVCSSDPTIHSWFNTSAFENPNPYTFGNVPRVSGCRGPKYVNLDASIFKTVKVSERLKIELRLESFDALNHPNFRLPNTTFVPASGNNGRNTSSTFGTINSDFQPRNVQLAVKLFF